MAAKVGAVQGRAIMAGEWRFVAKSVRLGFSACAGLARGNEVNVQCLRLDYHACDMAFDQLAVCKDGRRLFPHSCKVPADAVAHGISVSGAGTRAMLPASALQCCRSACET